MSEIITVQDLETLKKHEIFETEVITGKVGGLSTGADIATATNPVTGQIQTTLPQILRDLGVKHGTGDFTTGFTVLPGQRDYAWYDPVSHNWYSYLGVITPAGYVVAPGTNPVANSDWKPATDEVLRADLAEVDGASFVGGATYGDIRLYSGSATRILCTGRANIFDKSQGYFHRDDSDTTSADNDGIILIDALSRRWKRQFHGSASVLWFGADPTGVLDSTVAIQKAIDSHSDIDVPSGLYKVSKSSNFASDFPNSDQPCIYIRDKNGFTITGPGELVVSNHGQGIIELQRCRHVAIHGLKLTGPGQFPFIDGTTGLAEKGDANGGYNPPGNAIWQVYKNNSLNTSGYANGGYGGNFPQFGGGTASTWGVWNNGYIGNAANGILIHNDCNDIEVSGCEIKGFNFSGVAVGFYGDFKPTDLNYPVSKNIRIHSNYIHDIYNTGVSTMDCYNVIVTNNNISYIGHPDSSWSHTGVNPGYGYASLGNDFSASDHITVSNNTFVQCKRKGIDAHGGLNLVITGNTVDYSYSHGIFFNWSSPVQKAVTAVISNNIVSNIALTGIFVSGLDSAEYSYGNARLDCQISGNIITDCDGVGIYVLSGRDVAVTGNVIKYGRDVGSIVYGIFIGANDPARLCYNLSVTGNVITSEPAGKMFMGISVERTVESIISGNSIRNANGDGFRMRNQCQENLVTDNLIRAGAGFLNLDVNQVGGRVINNITIGGNGLNVLNDARSRFAPETITLFVAFNGTSSPTIAKRTGGDNVVSVASTSEGFVINLQGIGPNVRPMATIHDASDTAPLSGATRCNYRYQRPSTSTSVPIGIKSDGASGAHIAASAITSGQLLVRIELV